MKRWQQLLSCYLVLCVAFAGAVGISPQLHLWFEHDGHGTAHTHSGGSQAFASERSHAHPHAHLPSATFKVASPSRLVAADHSPALFGFKLIDVYRIAGQWLAQAAEHLPVESSSDAPKHTHHSLAQMLSSGAVEFLAVVPPLVREPTVFIFFSAEISIAVSESGFDPQTASRAPPSLG